MSVSTPLQQSLGTEDTPTLHFPDRAPLTWEGVYPPCSGSPRWQIPQGCFSRGGDGSLIGFSLLKHKLFILLKEAKFGNFQEIKTFSVSLKLTSTVISELQ
jgi:hypothetical protein